VTGPGGRVDANPPLLGFEKEPSLRFRAGSNCESATARSFA
jgi:hypothetical protein